MSGSAEQFLKRLEASGLLSGEDVALLKESLPDDADVADRLVQEKKLTAYQAAVLTLGSPDPLVLGDYVVLDKIGEGGMGRVFRAEHRRMARTVALKVLRPEITKNEKAVRRFEREVKAAAKLSHPNIVTAFDAREDAGTHYLITEYVSGSDLAELVRRDGPLPVERAVDCVVQAARGLQYAHDEGVIHRDVKPSNLLIDASGIVRILDMGTARLETAGNVDDVSRQAELTGSGQVMGTVDYMAPEQALDTKHADARSDVYGLGCTLFYLLTGKPVFSGSSLMQKLLAHRDEPIPSLTEACRDVPEELAVVYRKMVAKKPEDRFRSAAEAAAALAPWTNSATHGRNVCVTGETATASRTSTVGTAAATEMRVEERAGSPGETVISPETEVTHEPVSASDGRHRPVRRRTWKIGMSVFALVLLVLAVAYFSRPGQSPREPVVGGSRSKSELPEHAGYALEFDGESSYVEIPPVDIQAGGQLTVEGYFRPSSLPAPTRAVLVGSHDFSLDIKEDGRWHFVVWRGEPQPTPDTHCHSDDVARIDRRVHVAVCWNGKTHRLFVDGVPQREQTKASGFKRGSSAISLGALKYVNSPPMSVFHGLIDEVRVSNVARYTEKFMPQPRFEPDEQTTALYHFDEGDGDVLRDSSGNERHAKIVGAKWRPKSDLKIREPSPPHSGSDSP